MAGADERCNGAKWRCKSCSRFPCCGFGTTWNRSPDFPAGTPSTWSEAEQQELADFLRAAHDTKAKFLLTSRRDEHGWLGDLPTRLTLPPMPMQERMQLARALADKYRVPLTDVKDWQPLLEFTQGNPLTITVVVGQALREGIDKQRPDCRLPEQVARRPAGL